jgi:hypothetical protein
MARRGREAALKRAREKARQDKREAKMERKLTREPDRSSSQVDEASLMEEFARLSALLEADQISAEQFNEERTRIFTELGIESGD